MVWHDDKENDDGPKETVYCETCGEPVHLVVTWGDLPDEPHVIYDDLWTG